MDSLRQIAYVSTATRPLRESELLDILERAQAGNSELHVTGMLLYAEGAFIQVLEGAAQTVEKLMRKIRRDIRHRGFLILLDHVTGERDFDGWSMAFQRISQQDLDHIAGFYEWSAEMPTRRKNAAAIRLIECFASKINSISA